MLASDVHRDHMWTVEILSLTFTLENLNTHFSSNPISLWPSQALSGRPLCMNIEIKYFIHVTECGFVCMYEGV